MIAINPAIPRSTNVQGITPFTKTPSQNKQPSGTTQPSTRAVASDRAAAKLAEALLSTESVGTAGPSGNSQASAAVLAAYIHDAPADAGSIAKATDQLVKTSGAAIYGIAIESLKSYPEDLSTRQDEIWARAAGRNLTPEENAEVNELQSKRNTREEAAFMHFAHEATAATTKQQSDHLLAQYFQSYIEYYDSLSPEEQNSDRYKGTRAAAVTNYQMFSRDAAENADQLTSAGDPTKDLSESQDPIVMLFKKIADQAFELDDASVKDLLNSYKSDAQNLLSARSDPRGNANTVQAASDRLLSVQAVVDGARKGNAEAYQHLQDLANDPSVLDSFLHYSNTLENV